MNPFFEGLRAIPGPIDGSLLRANGRWSLVHRFLEREAAIDELRTACGVVYTAADVYVPDEDDDPIVLFRMGRSPVALTDCSECFATSRQLPEHLRDDAPYRVCSSCGRKTWHQMLVEGERCGMPQPDGRACEGRFGPLVRPR